MKKDCVFLRMIVMLAFILFGGMVQSQSINNYAFSHSTGAELVDMSEGTTELIGPKKSYGFSETTQIGFSFIYMGVEYTKFSCSPCGLICLNPNGMYPVSYSNNLASGYGNPKIAPYWDCIATGLDGKVHYKTIGESPNRKLVVEWFVMVPYHSNYENSNSKFQLILNEATGIIEFIYDDIPQTNTGYSIGMSSSSTQFASVTSGTNTVAYGIANNSQINAISAGTKYTFTPPSPATLTPTLLTFSDISSSGMTLNWEYNGNDEPSFYIFNSIDGIDYDYVGKVTEGSTSYVATELDYATKYYWRIRAFTEASLSGFLEGSQATNPIGEYFSIASGDWHDPATWNSGSIPTMYGNVTISNGHVVTASGGYFANLTVDGTLTLTGYSLWGREMTVSSTGVVNSVSKDAYFQISRNITNDGVIDFFISNTQFCNIKFNGYKNNQTFMCGASSTTNIGTVELNKVDTFNTVDIITGGTFTIRSGSPEGFLTLNGGTLKISGNATVSNKVFATANYSIPNAGGFWLNNPNFTVLAQKGTAINKGLFRLTTGTYNVGTDFGNNFEGESGAIFIIEGGVLNLYGGIVVDICKKINLSGGIINTCLGNTNKESIKLITRNLCISGGEINLVQKASNAYNGVDYNVSGTNINITGGTLNVGTGATTGDRNYRIMGVVPNLIFDNTIKNKSVILEGATKVYGNFTLNAGTTLDCKTYDFQIVGNPNQPGNIINNGIITNTSATGANRFTFMGGYGAQTLSGTGTLGNATTPFACFNIDNPAGVTIESTVIANKVFLTTGLVSGSNNITLGNGVSSSPSVQKGGDATKVPGEFDQPPVINYGNSYSVFYSVASSPYTTGNELPAVLPGTMAITTGVDVSLDGPKSVANLSFSATNSGKLITTDANLLTVSGSSAASVFMANGNTGYVSGPLARTLPANLTSGSTYVFPIGKSTFNSFELINPVTNNGGSVVIKAEVIDTASGGNAGYGIQPDSLGNKYWNTEVVSGSGNLVNTAVKVSQTTPSLVAGNVLVKSSSLTSTYEIVSTNPPVANAISSKVMTSLGYFAIGLKHPVQVYVSSTSTHPSKAFVFPGYENQVVLRLEVATSGYFTPMSVTDMLFSTNGTTSTTDISNAKLFYSGTSDTFGGVQVGATVANPSGAFNINEAQELVEGTNYFWLVYDISMDAQNLNVVDAEVHSIKVGNTVYTPIVSAPAGNRIIRTKLEGIYTISYSGDYRNITKAVADLNAIGVKGPVVFQLTDNTMDETFPIIINPIEGSSESNTVVFKSAPEEYPWITGTSAGPLFVINASNIVIDGSNTQDGFTRDMEFSNFSKDASSGIIYSSDNQNVTLKNIFLNSSNVGFGIILNATQNAVIENNQINRVTIGIQTQGNSSLVNISKNNVGSEELSEIVLTSGIVALNTMNFVISNNTVSGMNSTTSSTASGIVIAGSTSTGQVSGNTVKNIRNTNPDGWGSNGISLGSSNAASNISVFNNIISDIASYGNNDWGQEDNGYGILISSGGGYGVFHNTIVMNTNQSRVTGGNTAGINIQSGVSTPNSLDIRNNNIMSTQTKGTRYAVYSAAPANVFAMIDHNNYIAPNGIGYIGGDTCLTLANWQSATGKDLNSVSMSPVFVSATDFTPVANTNCAFDNLGTPIAIVDVDINGNARSATAPDLGAYEFTSIPLAAPIAENQEICSNQVVPDLVAFTLETAKWYSDETLNTLVHTGNSFSTGHTAAGEYTYYVTDNNGLCVSAPTTVVLTINQAPSDPETPAGPTSVVSIETTDYTIEAVSGATSYEWLLSPAEAGSVSGSTTSATVTWNNTFSGTATLCVIGHNENCSGFASPSLEITVSGPELTLIANPVEGGTVNGAGSYMVGVSVPVSATANTGYTFVNWTDATNQVVSTEASFNYTMPAANTTLTANFTLNNYTLTLEANPVGGGSLSGAGTYSMGAQASINTVANDGFQFVNWTDASNQVVSTQAAFNYTMPANNTTLKANFVNIYEVDFSVLNANGSLAATLNGNTFTSGSSVVSGSEVVFNAIPADGYKVKEWKLNGAVIADHTSDTYTLSNIVSDATITVEFELITYTLTFIVSDGNNPVSDASVTINNETINTESNGQAIVILAPGTYPYTISKAGYITYNNSAIITNQNATNNVTLDLVVYTANFVVKAKDNIQLENAVIEIDNQSITTNQTGEASIQLVPGAYPYTVNKTDYLEANGSIIITDSDVTENVTMWYDGFQEGEFANFMVYPNPFSNVIMISNPSLVKHVMIASINGQIISEIETKGMATISTEGLPTGMYLITFESHSGQRFITKMVKK